MERSDSSLTSDIYKRIKFTLSQSEHFRNFYHPVVWIIS